MQVKPTTRRSLGSNINRRVQKKKSANNAWMWWVGSIAVSVLITLVFKFSNKSSDDIQVKNEMIQVVHEFPNYPENAQYYDNLLDQCHHQAFELAYSMGGRRTASKIDVEKYLFQISYLMERKATSDGKKDVAVILDNFNQFVRNQ